MQFTGKNIAIYKLFFVLLVFVQSVHSERLAENIIVKSPQGDYQESAGGVVLGLPNGNRLYFLEVKDERGHIVEYSVSEVVLTGNRSIDSVSELRNADPLALFYALSEWGDGIPMSMIHSYGEPKSNADQGWARSQLLLADNTMLTEPTTTAKILSNYKY